VVPATLLTPCDARSVNGVAVRVVTVDDQAVFQRAAEVVIDASPGFELAGQAASGDEGLAVVEQLCPDLVLLDVRMPGMDGVETARRLTERQPEVVVVLITVQEPPVAPGASSCGAVTVVSKRQFCPALLRELWSDHARTKRPGPPPFRAEAGRAESP
jgi:DNA-binding NarL/FixJ family response regulator